MVIKAIAYPRAALIGNPSDGYFGKTIAFVFDNYCATAEIKESEELVFLSSPRDQNTFQSLSDLDDKIARFGYYGGIRLLKAAARLFFIYCQKNNIHLKNKNFTISYDCDIPNRLGLAGSSAIITAAMKAMCQFYEVKISLPELANMVLAVERNELSIPAGLQDRVAQVYNHPVYMDFNREQMEKNGTGIYKKITIPDDLNLFVAYRTDLAEGSEILHSRLRDDYNSGNPQVLNAMKEWVNLTEQMNIALKKRDYSKVAALINRNFDLRCEVCSGSISEKNRQMVEAARKVGASAKFTGSGGAIVGTYENENMFHALVDELKKSGVNVIKPHIVTSGNGAEL